jgi:rubrerythrin
MKGFKTVLGHLKEDLDRERAAVKTYREFANASSSEEARSMFLEFARAEQGHANGLLKLITDIEGGEHEVVFYCPVCGWEVNFGKNPGPGKEVRCRMCGAIFSLKEVDGDYQLQRMG